MWRKFERFFESSKQTSDEPTPEAPLAEDEQPGATQKRLAEQAAGASEDPEVAFEGEETYTEEQLEEFRALGRSMILWPGEREVVQAMRETYRQFGEEVPDYYN